MLDVVMYKDAADALSEIMSSNPASIVTCEHKGLLKGIPYHMVTLQISEGTEYRLESMGEEAAALEKEVHNWNSRLSSGGATPKIFVNGNGRNDESPTGAGCTIQRKSAGLPEK